MTYNHVNESINIPGSRHTLKKNARPHLETPVAGNRLLEMCHV